MLNFDLNCYKTLILHVMLLSTSTLLNDESYLFVFFVCSKTTYYLEQPSNYENLVDQIWPDGYPDVHSMLSSPHLKLFHLSNQQNNFFPYLKV